jgi:hypothetical protein
MQNPQEQDFDDRTYQDGVDKACEVIAIALREWASPAVGLGEDVAKAVAIALDNANIGAHAYIFRAIVTDTPNKWKEVTEDRYDEMLGVLPPIAWTDYGFLVGEPWDHHPIYGFSRYTAMLQYCGRFYESTRPVGVKAWKTLDLTTLVRDILP